MFADLGHRDPLWTCADCDLCQFCPSSRHVLSFITPELEIISKLFWRYLLDHNLNYHPRNFRYNRSKIRRDPFGWKRGIFWPKMRHFSDFLNDNSRTTQLRKAPPIYIKQNSFLRKCTKFQTNRMKIRETPSWTYIYISLERSEQSERASAPIKWMGTIVYIAK